MNLTKFLLQSRGPVNLAKRLPTIFMRFGLTPDRMDRCLSRFLDITDEYGVHPTLPVTAVPLARHPESIQELQRRGVELALHGLVHTDYTQLSLEEHLDHLTRAAAILRDNGIDYWGTRAPYMRANRNTLIVASRMGLLWDSNDVVHWNVFDEVPVTPGDAYQKVLNLYSAESASDRPVVPRLTHDVIEIPVSLPDDEAMVDRLFLGEQPEIMAALWAQMLRCIHARGDLFTMQLHHERVPKCALALRQTLRLARDLRPGVWIATLREIAEWWREKLDAKIEVNASPEGGFQVRANASPRTVLLARGLDQDMTEWTPTPRPELVVKGPHRPVIALSPRTAGSLRHFLLNEGFPFEETENPESYAVALDEPEFHSDREFAVLSQIECTDRPLVRLARWPDGFQSALSVTGDIDSLTLIDFFLRLKEV